jgi:hypothetical protein
MSGVVKLHKVRYMQFNYPNPLNLSIVVSTLQGTGKHTGQQHNCYDSECLS